MHAFWSRVAHAASCPHHHMILGHSLELVGVGLSALKMELLANGALFSGAVILLVVTFIAKTEV